MNGLPESLTAVIEVIGFEATIELVDHFGGIRVWVPDRPRRIRDEHPLAKAIGIDAARQLAETFSGEELCVPRAAAALRNARNTEICALYATGEWTAAQLARKFQLTERQIYSILSASSQHDDTQAALF